jgi:hypothetical protein
LQGFDKQAPLDRQVRYLTGQAKVHDLEKQIDQMVYKLFDRTSEEIAIVEGKR